MMNRARFVLLGAIVVALVYFGPDLVRPALEPVPTAHQPALLVDYDRGQIDAVITQIEQLDSVMHVNLEIVRTDPMAEPLVHGQIDYDGFTLMWRPEEQIATFNTAIRPWRQRWAGEPDPERIDTVMTELEALFTQLDHGAALFITDAELRAAAAGS